MFDIAYVDARYTVESFVRLVPSYRYTWESA